MPYHFEFDPAHKIMLVVIEGDIERHEMEDLTRDIHERAQRMHPSTAIADLTTVGAVHVPAYAMRNTALAPGPFLDETLRLIVAPTDHLFTMARMYEVFANRPAGKLQIVRSRDEALLAIGVQNPHFERVA